MNKEEFRDFYSKETVMITDRECHTADEFMAMAFTRLVFSTAFGGAIPRLYVNTHPELYIESSGRRDGCKTIDGSYIVFTQSAYHKAYETYGRKSGMFCGVWDKFHDVITDGDDDYAFCLRIKILDFLTQNDNLDDLFREWDITWSEAVESMTTSGVKGMTHWSKFLLADGMSICGKIINRFTRTAKDQIKLAKVVNAAIEESNANDSYWLDHKGKAVVVVIDSIYRMYNIEDVISQVGPLLSPIDNVVAFVFHDPTPQAQKSYFAMITDKFRHCALTEDICSEKNITYHRSSYDYKYCGYLKFTSQTLGNIMSALRQSMGVYNYNMEVRDAILRKEGN